MIVAVAPVHVMEMPGDEVVDVIAVRYRRVAAVRAVHVITVVTLAGMVGCTCRRIRGVDRDRALVHVVAMRLVEVPVVKIVDVVEVLHSGVTTAGAVDVVMRGMSRVGHAFLRWCHTNISIDDETIARSRFRGQPRIGSAAPFRSEIVAAVWCLGRAHALPVGT